MYRISLILLILFVSISNSYSQAADEVIMNNLQVRGSKKMFKDLKTLSFKATINSKGSKVTMNVFVQYPDKLRVELKNPLGDSVISVFDGKNGWVIKGGEVKLFPEGSYSILRGQIDSQIGFFYKNMNDYKKRKYTVALAGEDNTRNIPVIKLRIKEPNGTEWIVYYEKSRFFDIRFDLVKDMNGKSQNSTYHCKNFIPVGKYYFPTGADIYTNKTETGSIIFSDITVNPKPIKSMFKLPKK